MRSTGLLLDTRLQATLAKGGKLVLRGLNKASSRAISHRAACSIAFHSITRRGDLARIYRVAPVTVTRLRCVVAHITWRCDAALHAGISVVFGRQAPLVFVSGTYCDATKEKLQMSMHNSTTSSQKLLLPSVTKSSWNVLVSSQRFAWCFDNERQHEWYQTDFVRPNVPIASDAAECLLDGLYHLPATASFKDLEDLGMKTAQVAIAHWDLDGHPANGRMVAGRRAQLAEGVLASIRHCGNHANNLVEGCVVEAVSGALLAWLYMTSMFLSMGGNFLRLIHATPACVKKYMVPPQRGEPPESAKLLSHEVRDYSIKNFKSLADATGLDQAWSSDDDDDDKADHPPTRKRHFAFIGAWDRFLAFWNGDIWHDGPMGPHFCTGEGCCQGYDKNVTERRACMTIIDLIWRSQPVVPTKGKWTKLGAALDWHILASGLTGTFQKCFPIAFQRLGLKFIHRDDDAAFLVDVDWHALQGASVLKKQSGHLIVKL